MSQITGFHSRQEIAKAGREGKRMKAGMVVMEVTDNSA